MEGLESTGGGNVTRGARGELLVAADLMSRGFHVFRNESPRGPVDLVALGNDGKVLKVQATLGRIGPGGRARTYGSHSHDDLWNVIAVCYPDGVWYYTRSGEELLMPVPRPLHVPPTRRPTWPHSGPTERRTNSNSRPPEDEEARQEQRDIARGIVRGWLADGVKPRGFGGMFRMFREAHEDARRLYDQKQEALRTREPRAMLFFGLTQGDVSRPSPAAEA